jgi:drug/metabolite transporter (DMT)-like permease
VLCIDTTYHPSKHHDADGKIEQKASYMFSKLAPALFVCLWATGFIGARLGLPYSEPGTFLTIRFSIAFAVLALVAIVFKAKWPNYRIAAHSIAIGALLHGIYLGAVFWSIEHGMPAGVAAVIVGLQPLLTAILAGWILKETVTRRHWIGIALGLLGVILVLAPKIDIIDSGINSATVIAATLGMVSVTVGTIYQKRVGSLSDLKSGTALQYLGGTIPVAILAFTMETHEIEWSNEMIFAMAWAIFVLSFLAVFLLMWLIRQGSVAKLSTLFFLVPAVAAVMAYFLFGETLTPVQLGGMLLCAIAVALASSNDKSKRDKTSPLAQASDGAK